MTVLCLAGALAGCGAGNIATTAPARSPSGGTPSTSTTFDCNGQWMWGGNNQGIASTNGSEFHPAGTLAYPRAGHTATLLKDGSVLVVGGGQLDVDDLLVSISSAEIFDPVRSQFAAVEKPCSAAAEFQTATLLNNGKVLVAGGNEFGGYPTWLQATAAAELYDPVVHAFAFTGSMTIGRTHHTATLLRDGRVLIVGGATTVGSGANTTTPATSNTEIYDPSLGAFIPAASMTAGRIAHTATLLPSGEVLIAGGENAQGALSTAEIYDPEMNTFVSTGTMMAPRTGHTATLLNNGMVLIAGGATSNAFPSGGIAINAVPQLTAELYDPGTGRFSPAGPMSAGRLAHSATLLPDGRVLIAGGFKSYVGRYESLTTAEIFDPGTNSFSTTGPMNAGRFWHSATSLSDGTVLIIGGINEDLPQASAETFKN